MPFNGLETLPLLSTFIVPVPFKVTIELLFATTPVILSPETDIFPAITWLLLPVTRTPVDLFPVTSTNGIVFPRVPVLPVEWSLKNTPIFSVSPKPFICIIPLFSISDWLIPTIPIPCFSSPFVFVIIEPLLTSFEPLVSIPIP